MGLLLFSLPLGQQSITNIVLVLLFLHSLIFNRLPNWKAAFKHPLWWLSALFYAYLALSLVWTEDLGSGGKQLETKTSFLLAPLFIIAGSINWNSEARRFSLQALWWGLITAMFWALGVAAWNSWQAGAFYIEHEFGRRYFFTYTHLAEPLMHPGYLATYLGFGLFASVELLRNRSSRLMMWLYRLSIPLILAFMLLLQARINLIALFMVIVLAALFLAWKRKAYLWLALPLVPVLGLTLFLSFASEEMQSRYFQFPDFSYDISGENFNSATYRLAEWKCAGDVIGEHFWLGTGIGDSQQALLDSYRDNEFWQGLEKRYNAHNQYIETSLAGGIIGLALMLIMLFYYCYRAFRQMDYLALSGLIFLLICLLTESMFERMWGVLFFAMIFPLLLMKPIKSDSVDG